MSILKHKNSKIIDLTKPVEIKTYLAISVLGKSLNLNINYKKINVPELNIGEKEINIYLLLITDFLNSVISNGKSNLFTQGHFIYWMTNGFSEDPSPLVISVSALIFITGRTPMEYVTPFHGYKPPDGSTVQMRASE